MGAPVRCAHDVPAGVEATWAALTGEHWPVALDARLHDGSTLVERTATADGGLRLVTRRRLPDVPSWLARFVPADGTVTQTDTWDPPASGAQPVRSGAWEVALPGSPASLGGLLRLEPSGAGSRWVVEGSVAVRVPLVGGRAEGFLAPLVEKLVSKQAEVLRSLVA